MAFNEKLADRVREKLLITEKDIQEKKMFGGLCFMVNGKMCVCIKSDRLLIRLAPERNEEFLEMEGVREMDFIKKPMKGYVYVSEEVLNTNKKLGYWIDQALDYNKIANPSKKKKQGKKQASD